MSSDQNFVCVSYLFDACCIPTLLIILAERSEEFKSTIILCLLKIIISPARNSGFIFICVYCYYQLFLKLFCPHIAPTHPKKHDTNLVRRKLEWY
jgi:hypothetical protein